MSTVSHITFYIYQFRLFHAIKGIKFCLVGEFRLDKINQCRFNPKHYYLKSQLLKSLTQKYHFGVKRVNSILY